MRAGQFDPRNRGQANLTLRTDAPKPKRTEPVERRTPEPRLGAPQTKRGENFVRNAQRQGQKSGSGFGAILGALGGRRLRQLGAGATLLVGASMVPGIATADYVRLDQARPQIVESATNPSVVDTSVPFEVGHLQSYPLFQMFYDSDVPGTAHREVDALTPEGVGHLLEYARTHDLDGSLRASPPPKNGPISVTAGHQALIRHLIEDARYAGLITQEAIPYLRAAFNLPDVQVPASVRHAPVDAGEVRLCSDAEWWGTKIDTSWPIQNLPRMLTTEYGLGTAVGFYEAKPLEQRKYEMTCLFYQFGRALNAHDDFTGFAGVPEIKHQLQDELLDALFQLPVFDERRFGNEARELRQFFATDFNGSGMGLAQAIAKGFEPNDFPTSFQAADNRQSPVRLSMSTGNLSAEMRALDAIRVADGRDPQAVAIKSLPSLGYMVGEPSGHDKITFDESKPPLDRLNYGKMIQVGTVAGGFANDVRLSELPVLRGFTFPIDAITGTGWAVEANASTRMEIVRASNQQRLDVFVEIQQNDQGEPISWSLRFEDPQAGQSVPASEVIGLLKNSAGRLLGDGLANKSLETGYWGLCDDNGGADQLFGRFPDLPRDFNGQANDRVFIRLQGGLHSIGESDARGLVYMDLPGIGGTQVPRDGGFRFGYDASEIRWQRGTTTYTNFGELIGFTPSPFTQSTHEFISGDTIRITNSAAEPILGQLRLEGSYGPISIEAGLIRQVIDLGDRVRVISQNGANLVSQDGKPLTDLGRLDWSQASIGMDPDSKTPGRQQTVERFEAGDSLQTQFEKLGLAEQHITMPQFLRANPTVLDRPAQTILPGEVLRLPETQIVVTGSGGTVADLLAPYEAAGVNKVGNANRDALSALTVPVLETGATISLKVGDDTVQHTVADGETWETILLAHATDTISAADIEGATRASFKTQFNRWDAVTLPVGANLTLTVPSFNVNVGGDAPQTLAQAMDRTDLAIFQFSRPQIEEANAEVMARPAAWVKSGENLIVPERFLSFTVEQPFVGDFFMHRTDGVDITVRADEVQYIQGETPHDLRFSHYVSFVQRAEGIYVNEGSLGRGIANSRKWIDSIQSYVTHGEDRPAFSGDAPLLGIRGPLVRQDGDKLVFQAGMAGDTSVFAGWMQVDEATGRVLNEGFTYGEPDFVWGVHGVKLDWNARSTYIGSAMDPDYRIALFVNGVPDLRNQTEEGLAMAERLNLPSNWRSYIVTEDEVKAHLDAEAAAAAAAAAQSGPAVDAVSAPQ